MGHLHLIVIQTTVLKVYNKSVTSTTATNNNKRWNLLTTDENGRQNMIITVIIESLVTSLNPIQETISVSVQKVNKTSKTIVNPHLRCVCL